VIAPMIAFLIADIPPSWVSFSSDIVCFSYFCARYISTKKPQFPGALSEFF
jgi:hypothetical protein